MVDEDSFTVATAVSTKGSVEAADAANGIVIQATVSYYPDAVAPGCCDVEPGADPDHCRQHCVAEPGHRPDVADVVLLAWRRLLN